MYWCAFVVLILLEGERRGGLSSLVQVGGRACGCVDMLCGYHAYQGRDEGVHDLACRWEGVLVGAGVSSDDAGRMWLGSVLGRVQACRGACGCVGLL